MRKRRKEKGFAYSADSYLQHELEASFLYEDTPDQSKATADVKKDMESNRPMDRLVCGDVGFGKTEVAIRAAFKAACDGKQVAVLVPTTVLAYQHYQTFKHRLEQLPVTLEYLSRARTAKDTRRILEELEEGQDRYPHRNPQAHFQNRALARPGSANHRRGAEVRRFHQGEAAPAEGERGYPHHECHAYPTTLQFSLMGARDMSIMRTPPPNRFPIHTEVVTFNAETISDAINFEISRNGTGVSSCATG